MALFSIYVAITAWETDRNRAYLFVFFAAVAILMFFFKRKFRKKIENSNKQE
jgi:membrane protein implicated in regulation of membrane protease activity